MSFSELSIHPRCLHVLKGQKITEPTPVQAQSIPVVLEGADLVAVAQTGTGKTLAFGLPALTRLADGRGRGTQMLVLTPTRELAHQINEVLQPHAKALGLRTACIYGGVGMENQAQALRRGVEIIVATPGRLLDHMSRGSARWDSLEILVLDEADRMLDMGFLPDLKRIVGKLPVQRQTLLFSATFPPEIARMTKDIQKDALRIEIGAIARPADAVRQNIYTVTSDGKLDLLTKLLRADEVSAALVFLRTKHRTDRVAKSLQKAGLKAQAIHGGRSQRQRQQALDGFRDGRYKVLVATDVAARGIDVTGISHVVNYDIPGSSDDYIHRIGRTARASATGDAITFVSPEDHLMLGTIERALGKALPREDWEGAVHVKTQADRQTRGRQGNGNGGGNSFGKGGAKKRFRPRRTAAAGSR